MQIRISKENILELEKLGVTTQKQVNERIEAMLQGEAVSASDVFDKLLKIEQLLSKPKYSDKQSAWIKKMVDATANGVSEDGDWCLDGEWTSDLRKVYKSMNGPAEFREEYHSQVIKKLQA